MYRDLQTDTDVLAVTSTNIPKEAMAFLDYPFPKNLPSFMGHQDVLKYLQDFADHYDLYKRIKVRQG